MFWRLTSTPELTNHYVPNGYVHFQFRIPPMITACERSGKRSNCCHCRAGRKSGERERSGERTFQKPLDRERSVEMEAAEREWGRELAKSAAQSPLTANIKDNRSLLTFR